MKSNRRFAGRYAIGIEIGGTKTQVGIGTAEGNLLQATVQRMVVEREQGASAIRRNLTFMVDAALASSRLKLTDIEKVGIGFGGPVDALRGVTLQSFQIAGWKKFPLKEWAIKQWGKPVFLEMGDKAMGKACIPGKRCQYGRAGRIPVWKWTGIFEVVLYHVGERCRRRLDPERENR